MKNYRNKWWWGCKKAFKKSNESIIVEEIVINII